MNDSLMRVSEDSQKHFLPKSSFALPHVLLAE